MFSDDRKDTQYACDVQVALCQEKYTIPVANLDKLLKEGKITEVNRNKQQCTYVDFIL